jgi:CheY-like chemotaxis protein
MTPLPAVLLVDDDDATNFVNTRLLKRLNVCEEVIVALNGQRALELLHSRCIAKQGACPPLVLLDVNMPVMNGFEFLEAFMQQEPSRETMVIVLLTSSQLDEDMVRAQHLPVADFLNKPLTREKISEVMQRYF